MFAIMNVAVMQISFNYERSCIMLINKNTHTIIFYGNKKESSKKGS